MKPPMSKAMNDRITQAGLSVKEFCARAIEQADAAYSEYLIKNGINVSWILTGEGSQNAADNGGDVAPEAHAKRLAAKLGNEEAATWTKGYEAGFFAGQTFVRSVEQASS